MGSKIKGGGTIIGDYLRMAGLITGAQFDEAVDHVKQFGGLISTYLVQQGYIDRYSIAGLLSRVYGFTHYRVDEDLVDPAAVRLLPWSEAKRWMALPVGFEKGGVRVAMTEPVNSEALREIENHVGRPVRPVVAAYLELIDAFRRFYQIPEEEYDMLRAVTGAEESGSDPDLSDLLDSIGMDAGPDDGETPEAPEPEEPEVEIGHDLLVKMSHQILLKAVKEGATHVHIEPFPDRVQIRFRVDGRLRRVMDVPETYHRLLATRFKILGEMDITERRIPQNGRMRMNIQDREVDFYVLTLPTQYGEALVIETAAPLIVNPDIEAIGLAPGQAALLRAALAKPYGFILISGPAHAGRSVTAYAALKARLADDVKAVTIENRIKRPMDGALQTTVNPYTGFDLPRALAAVRGHNPDVCLLGDLSDPDALKWTIELAASGCLVIARTLAEDAAAAVARLFEMTSNPSRLAGMLHLCVGQRLLRNLCPECKQPVAVDREELLAAGFGEERIDPATRLFRAVGCPACGGVGYRGRTAVFECIEIVPEMKKALVGGAVETGLRTMAAARSMVLLRLAALDLCAQGVTSLDEALFNTPPFP